VSRIKRVVGLLPDDPDELFRLNEETDPGEDKKLNAYEEYPSRIQEGGGREMENRKKKRRYGNHGRADVRVQRHVACPVPAPSLGLVRLTCFSISKEA
jgi:hypothetical protein